MKRGGKEEMGYCPDGLVRVVLYLGRLGDQGPNEAVSANRLGDCACRGDQFLAIFDVSSG